MATSLLCRALQCLYAADKVLCGWTALYACCADYSGCILSAVYRMYWSTSFPMKTSQPDWSQGLGVSNVFHLFFIIMLKHQAAIDVIGFFLFIQIRLVLSCIFLYCAQLICQQKQWRQVKLKFRRDCLVLTSDSKSQKTYRNIYHIARSRPPFFLGLQKCLSFLTLN